jgi:preprotein translocase subunit SecG
MLKNSWPFVGPQVKREAFMQSFLMIIHMVLALVLIGLILLQHGRGADAGAAFGSGASATVFGARGSGSFLSRLTTILAMVFFANSLALAYFSANQEQGSGLMDQIQTETAPPAVTPEQSQDQAVPLIQGAPATDVPTAPDVPSQQE